MLLVAREGRKREGKEEKRNDKRFNVDVCEGRKGRPQVC